MNKSSSSYLTLILLFALAFVIPEAARSEKPHMTWINGTTLRIDGKGWSESGRHYTRLPMRAENKVTEPVWNLAHHTAGLTVLFTTNSNRIDADWSGGGSMYHMPQSSVSGLDLYKRNENDQWEFVSIGRPSDGPTSDTLVNRNDPVNAETEYLLFLPLYQKVDYLKIGIEEGASFHQPKLPERKPMVFLGTSIVQGGCASRAGMSHAAILRRWFDTDVINLGFSGSGKMEPIMGDLIAEIDASVYVLDCLPNMTYYMTMDRLEPLVRKLRQARPDTPIVLVEHHHRAAQRRNEFVRDLERRLRNEGWTDLYRIPGEELLKGEEEATVDGIHPTDLGFYRIAKAHRTVLDQVME